MLEQLYFANQRQGDQTIEPRVGRQPGRQQCQFEGAKAAV
jgi:hypothetical protein